MQNSGKIENSRGVSGPWSKKSREFPKMPQKGGGGDKAAQFWDAIRSQNQKTLHWCLNYGGISSATRDDDGYTGLHHAAMHGKTRSLETILDHIRRVVLSRGGGDIRGTVKNKKTAEEIDEKDEENGMTAFMHACAGGHYDCVKLLHVRSISICCGIKAPNNLSVDTYCSLHSAEMRGNYDHSACYSADSRLVMNSRNVERAGL